MIRVSAQQFEEMVESAIHALPAEFRERLENIAWVVEADSPSPQLFGYYHGVPLPKRSVGDSFRMPDRITIFQRPHELAARSLEHLELLVADTVWHEVGHYFGMSEADVRRWERRRMQRLRDTRRRRRAETSGSTEESH